MSASGSDVGVASGTGGQTEAWMLVLNRIQEALKSGRRVFIRGVEVRDIRVERTARSYVIIINNGELVVYPSHLLGLRITIS